MNQPDVFEQAVQFEKELQQEHPHLWLHQQGIPLEDVIFKQNQNLDLFCHNGECFT